MLSLFLRLISFTIFLKYCTSQSFSSSSYSSSSRCSKELEEALYNPKVCGAEYFCKLENTFRLSVPQLVAPSYSQIIQFCQRFSQDQQVGVSIIDSAGINLCGFRDQLASIYYQIFYGLNYLSSNSRAIVYAQFSPTGTSSSDYQGIAFLLSAWAAVGTPIATANAILASVNSQSKIGNQYVPVISLVTALSTIVAASNPSTEILKFNWIYRQIGLTAYFSATATASPINTAIFFLNVYQFGTFGTGFTPISPSAFLRIFSARVRYSMIGFGAASKVNGFSNLFSENLLLDRYCNWAFNYFYNQEGLVYRVIFYQLKDYF